MQPNTPSSAPSSTRPGSHPPRAARKQGGWTVDRVIRAWPAHQPLAAARRSRDGAWLFALPEQTLRLSGPLDAPAWQWIGPAGDTLSHPASAARVSANLLGPLDEAIGQHANQCFWIGALRYELAGVFEPAMRAPLAARAPIAPAASDSAWPLAEVHRCRHAWLLTPAGDLQAIGQPPALDPSPADDGGAIEPSLEFVSQMGRDAYTRAVSDALVSIAKGEVYELNLAHHLVAQRAEADNGARIIVRNRCLAAALITAADPACGMVLEHGGAPVTLASASPEVFLTFDAATRTLTARPMKGTAASDGRMHLEASPKERAELAMITDLMRNDLGRVCALGSVRVAHARSIEQHASGGLLQAISVVQGTLAEGSSFLEALPHLLPAGSITGAPKVQAIRRIAELERCPRSMWCGNGLLIEPDGSTQLSVLIRTAMLHEHEIRYPVGAGIVADSEPEAEWNETLSKASILNAIGRVNA